LLKVSKKRRSTLSPAEKAHVTRNKTYNKMRSSLLILDCTLKGEEKCSEGQFLEEYLHILNRQLRVDRAREVDVKLKHLFSPRTLRMELKYAYQYTIHLSSHGNVNRKGESFLDLRYGKLYANDLRNMWEEYQEDERPLLIVLSACCAGHKDLIEAVSTNGCRYCIAPKLSTNWEHAAIFCTFFYTYWFLRRMRPVAAYHKTIRVLPSLTGKWMMFDRGKEIPEPNRTYYPA